MTDEIRERGADAGPPSERGAAGARSALRAAHEALAYPFGKLKRFMPRGLFPRSLILIVAPVVLLQVIVTIVFFDRHYQRVTAQLSRGVAGDIAMILSVYESSPTPATFEELRRSVRNTMQFDIALKGGERLPAPIKHGPFDVLDRIIDEQLHYQIDRPYWFDSNSDQGLVDIRVALGGEVLHVLVRRSSVLATNWHIFLVWMVLGSLVILAIAVAFLRNQVRSILRLAEAAQAFGRGRDLPDFRPAGAREVRAAASALIDMRGRLSRYIEQRTGLLAGISHDLRTPLTRIRLQLALAEPSPDVDAMLGDLAEMEHMLDEYLAFARGEGSEAVAPTDIAGLIEDIAANTERRGRTIETLIDPDARRRLGEVPVRGGALRRAITNLVDNALIHGKAVRLSLRAAPHYFEIAIEDDGPGLPPEQYEEAFKPFRRLDSGLRSGVPGSGLGLAISRDLVRGHGGEIHLAKSPLGGLKASIRLPL